MTDTQYTLTFTWISDLYGRETAALLKTLYKIRETGVCTFLTKRLNFKAEYVSKELHFGSFTETLPDHEGLGRREQETGWGGEGAGVYLGSTVQE